MSDVIASVEAAEIRPVELPADVRDVTAGVLTDFYERVTVLDRDAPSAPGDYRRGAPQGRHAHGLMPRGAQLLEEVFPGLLAEMATDGAVRAEMLVGHRFRVGGDELPQVATGLRSVQATLPFHEEHLRRRLLEREGVQFMPGVDVVGLVADDASAPGVVGVRIILREPGSTEETFAADLVVDAMGRSGRTPYRLDQPEGQVPWSVSDTHRLFLDNTPAKSFDARITAVLDADYTHSLDHIKVPTLILTPSHEGLVSEDASRVMREGIPDAREVVIERADHMFRFSHPETYGHAVLDILDEWVDGVAKGVPA